jgi:hypothetical protein
MGSFIANLHVKGATPASVKEALSRAGVAPAYVEDNAGWVSVFPRTPDETGGEGLEESASALSKLTGSTVIAFVVHDSDVFFYFLFENGRRLDRYDSDPGYFDGYERPPKGGNVKTLLRFCGASTTGAQLKRLLHEKRPAESGTARPSMTPGEVEKQKDAMLARMKDIYPFMVQQHGDKIPPLDEMLAQVENRMRLVSQHLPLVPGGGGFTFAEDMTRELAGHLGLSPDLSTASYRYIRNGEGGPFTHVG